jgi:uncharacterized SAM-binding protein YcdF (DUF218 family)
VTLPLAEWAELLVLPLGASLALGALALALLGLRRSGLAGACIAAGLALLWAFSTPAVSDRLVYPLERRHPPRPLAALPTADAILVLGGTMKLPLPPREFPEVSDAADRVLHAARLHRAGKAPLVVVSGGPKPTRAEAESMGWLLEQLGVPPAAVVREDTSLTTHENCVRSREVLAAADIRRVLLVTSALHMPRALATCRAAGIDAEPAPTDYWVADEDLDALDFTPRIEALLVSHLALHERIGWVVYRLRGWLRDEDSAAATRDEAGTPAS